MEYVLGTMKFTLSKKFALVLAAITAGTLTLLSAFFFYLDSRAAEFERIVRILEEESERLHNMAESVRSPSESDKEALRASIGKIESWMGPLRAESLKLPELAAPMLGAEQAWREMRRQSLASFDSPVDPLLKASEWLHPSAPRLQAAFARLGGAARVRHAALRVYMLRSLLLILAVKSVAFLLGLWAVRRFLLRPLKRLENATHSLQGDAPPAPLPVTTSDELASLTRSFNDTSIRLYKLIHELRASEAFSRRILDASRDWISVLDLDGRVVSINEAGRDYQGSGSIPLGNRWADFFVHTDRPDLEAALAQAREPSDDRHLTCSVTAYGALKHWDIVITPIHDSSGETVQLLAVARDLTERKEYEDRLVETAKELERSNAELEEFAYISSHDLQEPLRTLSLYAQLLVRHHDSGLGPEGQEVLKHMTVASRRMSDMVRSLLAYSEARGGISREPADLMAAAQSALFHLRDAIQSSGATVQLNDMPFVLAEKQQLVTVFENLIGNALKYCGDNPPRITVGAETEGGRCTISVRDEGIGIAPEYHERIFGIFKRLHPQSVPGTGIGLAICRRIIENHGGRIWVESYTGRGATFRFTLKSYADVTRKSAPASPRVIDSITG